jgi:hypothetical protein
MKPTCMLSPTVSEQLVGFEAWKGDIFHTVFNTFHFSCVHNCQSDYFYATLQLCYYVACFKSHYRVPMKKMEETKNTSMFCFCAECYKD